MEAEGSQAERFRPSPRKRGRKSKVELAAASRHFLLARQKQQQEQRARAQHSESACANDGNTASDKPTGAAHGASGAAASLSAPDQSAAHERPAFRSSVGFGPFLPFPVERKESAGANWSGALAGILLGSERHPALSDLRRSHAAGSGGAAGLTSSQKQHAEPWEPSPCELGLQRREAHRASADGHMPGIGLRKIAAEAFAMAGELAHGAHEGREGRISREVVWSSIQCLQREAHEARGTGRTHASPSPNEATRLWNRTVGSRDPQQGGLHGVEQRGQQQARHAEDTSVAMGCENLPCVQRRNTRLLDVQRTSQGGNAREPMPWNPFELPPRRADSTGENMVQSPSKERAVSSMEDARMQGQPRSSAFARAAAAGNAGSGVTSTSGAAGTAPQTGPLPAPNAVARPQREQDELSAGSEEMEKHAEGEDSEGCGRVPLWGKAQEEENAALNTTPLPHAPHGAFPVGRHEAQPVLQEGWATAYGAAAMVRRSSLETQLLQLMEEQQMERLHLAGLGRRHSETLQNERMRVWGGPGDPARVAHGSVGQRIQPGAPLAMERTRKGTPALVPAQQAMPVMEDKPRRGQVSVNQRSTRDLDGPKAQDAESSASRSHESMLLRAATAAIGAATRKRRAGSNSDEDGTLAAARVASELKGQSNETHSSSNPTCCPPPAPSATAVPALAWMVQSLVDKAAAGSLQAPGEGAGESSPAPPAAAGASPLTQLGRPKHASLLDERSAQVWPPLGPMASPMPSHASAPPPLAAPFRDSPQTLGGGPVLPGAPTEQALRWMPSMAPLQECVPVPMTFSQAQGAAGQPAAAPLRRPTRFTPAGVVGPVLLPVAGLAGQGVPQGFASRDWGLSMPSASPAGPYPAVPTLSSQQLQMLGWALSQQSSLGSSLPGSGKLASLGLPSPWTLLGVPGPEPWSSLGHSWSHDVSATLSNIVHGHEGFASLYPAFASFLGANQPQVANQPQWASQRVAEAGQHVGGPVADEAEAGQSRGDLSRTQSLEELQDLRFDPSVCGRRCQGFADREHCDPQVPSRTQHPLEENPPREQGQHVLARLAGKGRDGARHAHQGYAQGVKGSRYEALQGGANEVGGKRKHGLDVGRGEAAKKHRGGQEGMLPRSSLPTPELVEGREGADPALGPGRGMSPGLDLELHL